jgi:hypothetical protein
MTDDELRAVLAERFGGVRSRMAAACARVQRDPNEVTLVAVTKTVSPRVAALLPELGVCDLGESRPQELWRKAETLRHLPIRWHLVGHLQRNKIDRTLTLAHMIHSVDSVRLFEALNEKASQRDSPILALLEVNASREEQKHGFRAEELDAAWDARLADAGRVEVVGLMCMAAYTDDPEAARPTFAELRRLRDDLRTRWSNAGARLAHLSMGMSGDFEVAIEEGATFVRIGTTIFAGLEGE